MRPSKDHCKFLKKIGIAGAILLLGLLVYSCKTEKSKIIDESAPMLNNKWQYLFDGTTIVGWREYNAANLPSNWLVENGSLKSTGANKDIVFDTEKFGEFELKLEWKLEKEGNSGIFYHVVEGDQYHAMYENAPEYQLIDDLDFPEDLEDWQKTGADYAMYAANEEQKILNTIGEWNSTTIKFTNKKVEHWLNGHEIIEFIPWSKDWYTRKESGKWQDFPDYGKAKSGYIGLQDHGGPIWFRNIRIRKL